MARTHPIFLEPRPTRESPYSRGEFRLLECLETGLVYLDNPPDYEDLATDHTWEQTFEAERQRRRESEPVLSRVSETWTKARTKARKVKRIVRLLLEVVAAVGRPGKVVRVLDVGCGDGRVLGDAIRVAPEGGPKIQPLGIEISPALAAESEEVFAPHGGRVELKPGPVGVASFAEAPPQVVLMNSYLEHEVNARELLESLCAILPKGARLVIKVPNFASWNRKVRGAKWCGFRFPDHVNYFGPDNLKKLLEVSGFEVPPQPFSDRLPTSDNFYTVAVAPGPQA